MTNARVNNRSVSFNGTVRCTRTLHVNDYTDEELFNTWFTRKEYKQIKKEVALTVAMMDKKTLAFTEGLHFSSRGLEDKTADLIVQKVEHRFFAMESVLAEQERQRVIGIDDPKEISLLYMEYSFVSHMEAFLMAASDEKIAFEYSSSRKSSSRGHQANTTKSGSSSPKPYSKVYRISAAASSHRVSMAA